MIWVENEAFFDDPANLTFVETWRQCLMCWLYLDVLEHKSDTPWFTHVPAQDTMYRDLQYVCSAVARPGHDDAGVEKCVV